MDESLNEIFVSTERIYAGKVVNLRRDIVSLPNGREASREVVEHPGAVAIVPVLPDGRILLVRQFRHPVGKVLIEIPAGKLDKGEAPDRCALRELEEETGYRAGSLECKASIFTGPGFTDEVIHLYEASQLQPSQLQPDDDEFLQVQVFTPEEIRQMIHSGEIEDAKTIVSLLLHGANGGSL